MSHRRMVDIRERDPQKIAEGLHRLAQTHTVLPHYTAAVLGAATSGVNIVGKAEGKGVWDSTNSLPLWASGPDATDAWNDATGSASITPS